MFARLERVSTKKDVFHTDKKIGAHSLGHVSHLCNVHIGRSFEPAFLHAQVVAVVMN